MVEGITKAGLTKEWGLILDLASVLAAEAELAQPDIVEKISLGSLWQSLKITVATLTDPRVILYRLWCA